MTVNTLSKVAKPTLARRLVILALLAAFGAAAVGFVKEMVAPVTTFYGVDFPAGEVSFADTIVSYEPIIYLNDDRLPNVQEPFNNAVSALGAPNSTDPQHPFASLSARHDVSLGLGGSLTLRFTNNALTGSGNSDLDLWIFEAGERTESVFVEISKDGKTWHAVGRTDKKRSGIDIDAFGWGPEDYFAYVRLTDDPEEGEHDGIWNNGEWVGWGGADIDAVGAISSVSLISSVSHASSFSIPLSRLMLLVMGILVAGIGIGYLVNTFLFDKKNSKQNF
ncbi:hypothetical protein Ple7327_0331 [Pleurocapsa sp. PCC 7327]|uniref:hypothetical protein n=1 Tax=Pleurocapsa sp. PCC 7327 TaxID=118163 RepID=UPI00029F9417|nr:hypothetical protein [Pleurocapsa sp. PCC 7327]AFY75796.1 hypothetical protein Ple7327_0331 [Pleurocapsa sp. PCC 7327]